MPIIPATSVLMNSVVLSRSSSVLNVADVLSSIPYLVAISTSQCDSFASALSFVAYISRYKWLTFTYIFLLDYFSLVTWFDIIICCQFFLNIWPLTFQIGYLKVGTPSWIKDCLPSFQNICYVIKINIFVEPGE